MNIRAIALVVPLALGSACMHSSQRATAPAAPEPQATAPAPAPHRADQVVVGRIADVGSDAVSSRPSRGRPGRSGSCRRPRSSSTA